MGARNKITVVGAGNVGATAAHWLAAKELGDVVLVDIVEGVPQGKALDLAQAAPIEGYDVKLVRNEHLRWNGELRRSNHHCRTAAAKPGMSRDDLPKTNADIVSKVVDEVVSRSPDSILIIVSNPLDAMCQGGISPLGFSEASGDWHGGRTRFGADALFPGGSYSDVSVENVTAFVLGGHGDTNGAAAAFLNLRRNSDSRVAVEGSDRCNREADRRRRR